MREKALNRLSNLFEQYSNKETQKSYQIEMLKNVRNLIKNAKLKGKINFV